MGSLLGFLRYNSYPARVFMGDGGSQLLGFTVGVLAVLLTQNEALPFSAALPLLLLGLPILDTLTVMAHAPARGPLAVLGRPQPPASPAARPRLRALRGRGRDLPAAGRAVPAGVASCVTSSDVAIVAVFRGSRRRCCWRCSWPSVAAGAGAASASSGSERAGSARRLPWLKAAAAHAALDRDRGHGLRRWPTSRAWRSRRASVGRDIGWLAAGPAPRCSALAIAAALADARASSAITQGALYVAVVMAVYLDHVEPDLPKLFVVAKLVLFPVLAAGRRACACACRANGASRSRRSTCW